MGFIGKQPAKAAITSSDITDGVVTAAKLASDSVTTAKIADNGVTTAKINADAVTDAKIADDVVGSEHLTAGEVDTTALGADAVTAAKIADDAISEEHLDATVITGMTELAAEPADTDEFLISDAGTLKRIDYSHIKGDGITEADQWKISANSNQGSNSDITSNWERNDQTNATYIGTGLTKSSGIFSFPSTGKYLINAQFTAQMEGSDTNVEVEFKVTTNNSSYTTVAYLLCGNGGGNDNTRNSLAQSYLLDVTDTSNVKFKFKTGSFNSSTLIVGDTNLLLSGFTSIRLGDT